MRSPGRSSTGAPVGRSYRGAAASPDADPLAGLRSAIQAVEASPTNEAEGASRAALAADLLRKTLHGHTGHVYRPAFSPDGKLVVTASADGTARIWDVASGRSLHTLSGHTGDGLFREVRDVLGVAFSPDGKLVVTASADWTARI